MIELRWLLIEEEGYPGSLKKKVLQYRTRNYNEDYIGNRTVTIANLKDGWTDWQDIPEVIEDEA